jgi:hypothetical protein
MKKNKTQQQFHSEREEILESERKKSFNFQNRERFLLPALLRFVAIARVKIIDQTKPTISKLQPCHRRQLQSGEHRIRDHRWSHLVFRITKEGFCKKLVH